MGSPFLVSHFECIPGSVYVTALQQAADGSLTPGSRSPVDFSSWGGVWFPCAGQVTRWNTHLGSEEYEPNARAWAADGTLPGKYGAWERMARFHGGDATPLNPYHYGYLTEVTVTDAEGGTSATKHPAMGRFSHELGFVVGDDRTVYLSDDGRATGWYMFVADEAEELASGTLYAAQFMAGETGAYDLSWISLGHASDADIRPLIDAKIRFDQMFEVVAPEDGACPEGFAWTAHSYGTECLKLAAPSAAVPNPAQAASRLETRRYAAMMGATTELEKAEGITWDPSTGRVYLAISKVAGRMLAEADAVVDHIGMSGNDCGMIWEGATAGAQTDVQGAPIDSALVMTRFSPVLAGTPLAEPDGEGNRCAVDGMANPDNITLLRDHGLLMIGEDTKAHRINVLWAYDLQRQELTRVLAAPRGAEVTGLHWIPNLGGHGYLTLSVQHPFKELIEGDEAPEGLTDDDMRSWTAVLGPFPPL